MDVMEARRRLLMQAHNRIPSEYQEVEWVNGSNCNIDLSYVVTDKPLVITKFALTNGADRDVMGFETNKVPSFIVNPSLTVDPLNTTWYNRYYNTTVYSFGYQFAGQNDPHEFEFSNYVKVDGVTIRDTINSGDWSGNTQSMHLFSGRTNRNHQGLRVYTFALYDGNNLVRKLIPCYHKTNGTIGMYDIVSKQFFTSTIGTFTKGQDV